jgi:L-asparagine transporter-like permease
MSDIREPKSPIHPHQHKLVPSLGLLDVVMIRITGMIGGSIFVLTGPAIGLAGSSVILAFILNAIITLFTAMGYAKLGQPCKRLVEDIYGYEKDYVVLMLLLVGGWHRLLI